jgi:hypothetical protein
MLAEEAADYIPPSGKYSAEEGTATTLRAILEAGDTVYLKMLLRRLTTPAEYVAHVWAFARVYMPDAYAEALAEKQKAA